MDEAKSGKSGKSRKSGNSGKAVWDPFAAEVFLDVCIEQVLARNRHEGYLNQTGYQNLIKNFNERTKRNYVRKQFKNRWETLKKEYSTWKTLNQSASGLGRDPITKTIDASDEWWELEIKRCPDAAKFRHAPLANEDKMCQIFDKHCVTNEHARVPLPTSLAGPSQGVPSFVNIDDDDLSGTEIDVQVTPGTAGRGKKRACPYSPSPAVVEKMERDSAEKNCLRRICDIFEKREESRNSVTSQPSQPAVDPVRQEFLEMMAKVVADGCGPGTREHFYASQLFMKAEYRIAFSCYMEAESDVRMEWIRMAWEERKNK